MRPSIYHYHLIFYASQSIHSFLPTKCFIHRTIQRLLQRLTDNLFTVVLSIHEDCVRCLLFRPFQSHVILELRQPNTFVYSIDSGNKFVIRHQESCTTFNCFSRTISRNEHLSVNSPFSVKDPLYYFQVLFDCPVWRPIYIRPSPSSRKLALCAKLCQVACDGV
ncbi:hypothetical protein I7I53_09955 [Histoplasma capsulatum var. duboisii H88]|uniref:Uncharacterized protein n=1 Tax=Ajellomyces capsulatus (strain H88) TaxID=544711 RepID=A0A8A1L7P0_AJEC8|nr:hypothetical protein I7I53_09955 [Histoplasma capsulatum var. duboisii H88]